MRWTFRTLLLGLLLSSAALAHETTGIQSGSLNEGAITSVVVFVSIFAVVLLVSLGGLAYTLLGARFAPAARAVAVGGGEGVLVGPAPRAQNPRTPWAVAFGSVALLSLIVLGFGLSNFMQRQNAPIYPTAVLYPQGWEVGYGRGALQDTVTVEAGAISYLHLSSAVEGARLELPELGLRLPLPKGQKLDVQFVALRPGEYRSKTVPPLIVRSLERDAYQQFVRSQR